MKKNTKNILSICLFFLAALITLNTENYSLSMNIIGIAFIIAGTYGLILICKNKKFMF